MKRKKILVIDDESGIRDLYIEEFKELGYDVEVAYDGIEALRLLEENAILSEPFSLIILDLRMPYVNGIEVLKRVKEKFHSMPVIICTAYEEYKHDYVAWSSDAYVVKSADTSILRDCVSKILG